MIGEILNSHDHYALLVSSRVMVPPSTIAFSWGPHNSKNSLWFIDVGDISIVYIPYIMEKSTISKCGEHNSNGFNHMNFDWLVELIMVDNGNTNNNG